jgi:hypothetical protein
MRASIADVLDAWPALRSSRRLPGDRGQDVLLVDFDSVRTFTDDVSSVDGSSLPCRKSRRLAISVSSDQKKRKGRMPILPLPPAL